VDEIKIKVGAGCWYGVGRGWKVEGMETMMCLVVDVGVGFGFGGAHRRAYVFASSTCQRSGDRHFILPAGNSADRQTKLLSRVFVSRQNSSPRVASLLPHRAKAKELGALSPLPPCREGTTGCMFNQVGHLFDHILRELLGIHGGTSRLNTNGLGVQNS